MGSMTRARQRALRVVPAVIAAAALTGSSAVALAGTASTSQSAGPTIKLYAAQLHAQVAALRALVMRREHYELLILTWLPGQGSVPHDHAGSISASLPTVGGAR